MRHLPPSADGPRKHLQSERSAKRWGRPAYRGRPTSVRTASPLLGGHPKGHNNHLGKAKKKTAEPRGWHQTRPGERMKAIGRQLEGRRGEGEERPWGGKGGANGSNGPITRQNAGARRRQARGGRKTNIKDGGPKGGGKGRERSEDGGKGGGRTERGETSERKHAEPPEKQKKLGGEE